MATIIDGKAIAKAIRLEVAHSIDALTNDSIRPKLVVVLVGTDPASQVYVRSKAKACQQAGMLSDQILYDSTVTEAELLEKINILNHDHTVHGILVQLPLPKHINETRILEAILPEKDVDGFHPVNVGKLVTGDPTGFVPATPAGIIELLHRSGYDPQGKHVVVVGRSNIVGKPAGMLFLQKGRTGDATVTFCHSKTPDLKLMTKQADILVAAIGRPQMITADMVKAGVVVIDVGTNRVDAPDTKKGYRLVGDVDFEAVKEKAAAITPVPGGVGPMTIALLLKNTLKSYEMLMQQV